MTELIKSAIVTGASRGIGAAVAERLARDGIAVSALSIINTDKENEDENVET